MSNKAGHETSERGTSHNHANPQLNLETSEMKLDCQYRTNAVTSFAAKSVVKEITAYSKSLKGIFI